MNMASGYIFLVLSVVFGIGANGFLKTTEGFTNLIPTILCVVSIVTCLFCLSKTTLFEMMVPEKTKDIEAF